MKVFTGKKGLRAAAFALWAVCGVLCCSAAPAAAADGQTEQELIRMVEAYRASIMHADDIQWAEKVWLLGPEASFMHPRGHERGWEEIKNNFYRKIMGETFSRRELCLTGTPVVRVYGNAAVVEFDWAFTAERRQDGKIRQSRGRESQVYVRTPKGWKLVQAHYSGAARP